MPFLRGTITTKETTKVDVSLDDIREFVETHLRSKHKHLIKGEYVDSEGFWKVYYDYCRHTGDDKYRTGDKVTDEEIEFQNKLNWILDQLK